MKRPTRDWSEQKRLVKVQTPENYNNKRQNKRPNTQNVKRASVNQKKITCHVSNFANAKTMMWRKEERDNSPLLSLSFIV